MTRRDLLLVTISTLVAPPLGMFFIPWFWSWWGERFHFHYLRAPHFFIVTDQVLLYAIAVMGFLRIYVAYFFSNRR